MCRYRREVSSPTSESSWQGVPTPMIVCLVPSRKGASVNRVFDGLIVATDENGATVLTIDVLDTTEYEIVIDPVWSGAAGYVSAVRSSPAWRRGP